MGFFEKNTATHSNAPAHWPKVALTQFENKAVNIVQVAGALAGVMKPPAASMALMESFVYDDGILDVPIVAIENGKKTGIFVYGAEADAAAKYSAVRSLLRTRENAGAVYYGPQALTPAPPAKVLKPIDTPMFAKPGRPRADASYALWWPTPDDPRLADSPDLPLIDTWFERLNGHFFLLFSAFVNDLKLGDAKAKPAVYSLPDQPLLVQLTGPGRTDVMLHASQMQGLFLGFDEATTSPGRRHTMLRLLADFAVSYRKAIDTQGKIPKQDAERGAQAWADVRAAMLAREAAGEQGVRLHAAGVAGGRITRASTTSDAQRAAQQDLPDDAILDFAIDLAERVARRLTSQPIQASTPDTLAGPNLHAVIAAKAGGRLYERTVPYENPDIVGRAAAAALDEWPDAEVVAFLVDGAIREHGERVDVLDVTVQQAGAASAAQVMQRYKASATGTLELIGRPTVMATKPFLTKRLTTGHGLPPAAEMIALVGKIGTAVAEIHSYGKAHVDADRALRQPIALTPDKDGKVITTVFAMQGPLTAAASCAAMLKKPEFATTPWVAFVYDDLMRVDGTPERRTRLCVCRRGHLSTALFDRRYEGIEIDGGFRWSGDAEFRRWGAPLLS